MAVDIWFVVGTGLASCAGNLDAAAIACGAPVVTAAEGAISVSIVTLLARFDVF
jgi:hypothetical protein